MFTDPSQMFEQAVDVVLRALSQRSTVGAKPRASAESIGRLVSARACERIIQRFPPASAMTRKPSVETEGDKLRVEATVSESDSCAHCTAPAKDGAPRTRLLLAGSPSTAEVLLVGECGCSVKDAEIASFGGASGELLLKMLKTMGLSRYAVNMANVILCESASGGQFVDLDELSRAECRESLRELVRKQPARLIIAMGENAAASLFGGEPGVESSRSAWREFEGVPVMTTFHASHLIQNPAISERRKVWEDLLLVMDKLGMKVSDRQRGFFLK